MPDLIKPSVSREIRSFLETIWPDGIPEGATLPCVAMRHAVDRPGPVGVEFAPSIAVATKWLAARDAAGEDVYIAITAIARDRANELAAAKGGRGLQRGRAADAVSLPGFYIDLDAGPGKFPTVEAAIEFAESKALTIPPSMLIRTGHGVHAWWLLREPYPVDAENDLRRAESIVHGWSLAIRHAASSSESAARTDAVWDLARIGRVPGTTNRKAEGERLPVQTIRLEGNRYSLDEFEIFAVEPTRATAGQGSILETMGGIRVRSDADAPASKFHALSTNYPEFLETWNHKRPDLGDQSNSGYDMALANIAAEAGWVAQEIVDLLVAHRREWANHASSKLKYDPLHLKNPGYYLSTVAKAMASAEKKRKDEQASAEEIAEAAELAEAAQQPGLEDDQFSNEQARRRVEGFFKNHLGVEIDRIERFGGDDPTYTVTVRNFRHGNGQWEFPSIRNLHSWQTWRDRVMSDGLKTPTEKPPKGWSAALATMHRTIVHDIRGTDFYGQIEDHMIDLFESAADTQRADGGDESVIKRRTAALRNWGWYRDDDALVIHPSTFLELNSNLASIRPIRAARDFAKTLRRLGAESTVVAVRNGTRRVYRLYPRADARESTRESVSHDHDEDIRNDEIR